MQNIFRNKKYKRYLLILLIALFVAVSIYLFLHGSNNFNHRGLRKIHHFIQSFGIFSPIIIIFLIFLSTAIPPLPLPVPLIELVAGVTLGFYEGAFIVWVSQIGSSVLAFYIAKYFKKRFFGESILKDRRWDVYRSYLNKKGAFAIFLIRFVMGAPFNIISYLAGLTQITILNFIIATALGTIPESLLYTFLGSQIRTFHISLVFLSLIVIIIGTLGFIFTLILMFLLRERIKQLD